MGRWGGSTRTCPRRDEKHVLLTEIPILDELLHAHVGVLGRDFVGYRNHTYRVVNLCVAQSSRDRESLEKMAIAAAFHDMGIWTDGTFDYLPPSVRLATAYLAAAGRTEWTAEISEMILEHHKISEYLRRSTFARRAVSTIGLGGCHTGAGDLRAIAKFSP